MKHLLLRFSSLAVLGSVLAGCVSTSNFGVSKKSLANALTFHASFDLSTVHADADIARGDRRLHSGPQQGKPRPVTPGFPPNNTVHIAPNEGRFGSALRFERKISEVVAYRAESNIGYQAHSWSGSVSYWLRLSPDEDLEPGYCDPIQITSKAWDDAAFFTEFTKDERPREFRLGVYADKNVWNPNGRKWDDIPMAEKPLAPVIRPPFQRDQWTHVVFTWSNFNSGQPDGFAKLYINGELRGEISPRTQTFTWDPKESLIMLGLSYTGWMDDLAAFNRELSPAEIRALGGLKNGVKDLHPFIK